MSKNMCKNMLQPGTKEQALHTRFAVVGCSELSLTDFIQLILIRDIG